MIVFQIQWIDIERINNVLVVLEPDKAKTVVIKVPEFNKELIVFL